MPNGGQFNCTSQVPWVVVFALHLLAASPAHAQEGVEDARRPLQPDSSNRPLAAGQDQVGREIDHAPPPLLPPKMFRRVKLDEKLQWLPKATEESRTVSVPEAKWIKLHFLPSTQLGERSSVTIRSTRDDQTQTLNSGTLKQWNYSSAMFNGDTVEITVHLDSSDYGIQMEVEEVTIGIPPPPDSAAESGLSDSDLCNRDLRATSQHRAVGRILEIGCTGWIISNGAFLSAGHCDTGYMSTLEFQVPPSLPDGSIQVAATADQYSIFGIQTQANTGSTPPSGKDWAVFSVQANTETQLLPAYRQQAFYRLTDEAPTAAIALPGYGFDNVEHGSTQSTSWANEYSFTQQTQGVSLDGVTAVAADDVTLEYSAYRRGGDSGGPVVNVASLLTLGIATRRCLSDNIARGTGFSNRALQAAIEKFPGPNAIYVDNGHPATAEDGSIFRPYNNIVDGLAAVPDGGILSIVTGQYTISDKTVFDKPVTLSAPVGPATIAIP